MTTPPTSEQITAQAQRALTERLASVQALADTARELASERERVRKLEQQMSVLWTAALKDGWTDRELRDFGLVKPAGRPRRRTTPSAAPTTSPSTS